MPAIAVETRPFQRRTLADTGASTLGLKCETSTTIPFTLRWNEMPEAGWFRVYRDGQALGDTAVAFLPDAPNRPAAAHQYRVEAWRDGKVLATETITAQAPDSDNGEAIKPMVRWTRKGAWLEWPSTNLHVAAYLVERTTSETPGTFVSVGELSASRRGPNQIPVELTPGKTVFRITPVNQASRKWPSSEAALEWPADQLQEATLDGAISKDNARGDVEISGRSARFTGAGYLELPHNELLNFEGGGTVSFEFRLENGDEMPVLLSHGQWQVDGWFLQILGRRLIVRTALGDLEGPEIQPGTWYAVRWEHDGMKSALMVDGKTVSSRQLQLTPCSRVLRVGQYESPGPQYAVRGSLRDLKISGWVHKPK